jgi:hypothetical protein
MATKKNQTSFKPGTSANPAGRPAGTTPRAKFRKMIDPDLPGIVEVLVQAAKGGDVGAIKTILDRLIPALKPTAADLSLRTTGSLAEQGANIIKAMMTGAISPDAAKTSLDVLTGQSKLVEQSEIVNRLNELEALLCPTSKK